MGLAVAPVFVDNGPKGMEIVGSVSAYIPNLSGASTLPGLLRAQDISPFAKILEKIWSIDEAQETEEQEKRKGENIEQPPPAEVGRSSEATGASDRRIGFKNGGNAA